MQKYKTKECHQCGYSIIQSTNSWNGKPDKNDENLLLSCCPFCNETLYNGEIEWIAGCATILANRIYAQYIFGNPEKEKLYNERINRKPIRTTKEIAEREKAKVLRQKRIQENKQIANPNIPKCPTCGSTNIRHISSTERGVNAVMFGFFGNKRKCQFECLNPNCRYRW